MKKAFKFIKDNIHIIIAVIVVIGFSVAIFIPALVYIGKDMWQQALSL